MTSTLPPSPHTGHTATKVIVILNLTFGYACLKTLQWLPITCRIKFKITVAYKVLCNSVAHSLDLISLTQLAVSATQAFLLSLHKAKLLSSCDLYTYVFLPGLLIPQNLQMFGTFTSLSSMLKCFCPSAITTPFPFICIHSFIYSKNTLSTYFLLISSKQESRPKTLPSSSLHSN